MTIDLLRTCYTRTCYKLAIKSTLSVCGILKYIYLLSPSNSLVKTLVSLEGYVVLKMVFVIPALLACMIRHLCPSLKQDDLLKSNFVAYCSSFSHS